MSLGMLGKYERLDILGHGASGIVYLAQDTLLKKHVALKEITAQGEEQQRVLEEARVLDRLRHPNIVAVNSVDTINGKVIIDMEYVKGSNLLDILRTNEGALPVSYCLNIASQICEGLAYAHNQRVVHRDIKPANILVSDNQVVKLADFGLAQVLGVNSYAGGAGTFAYMAPEDFEEGERSDRQSDIWSVGVILYEMLTGHRPFNVTNPRDPFAWSRAIANEEVTPPSAYQADIPAKLDSVCMKALSRNKDERYLFIGELASDLRDVGATEHSEENIDTAPKLGHNESAVELPEINPLLESWSDIDGFLRNAPDHWDEAIELLADGSLRVWLNQIHEPLLAKVAGELQDEVDEDQGNRLRDFLYRAGFEIESAASSDFNKGSGFLAEGLYPEAVELLQRAVHLDPSRTMYSSKLAQAARLSGDIELARDALFKALILFPKDRTLKQQLTEIGGAPPELSVDSIDFGTIRHGEVRQEQVIIRAVGTDFIKGRVASGPGWLTVTPVTFNSKLRQQLKLTADSNAVHSEALEYSENLVIETSGGTLELPVSMTVAPVRPGFSDIIRWYLSILILALLPAVVGEAATFISHGHNQELALFPAGFIASGALFVSFLMVNLVVDTHFTEKAVAAAGIILFPFGVYELIEHATQSPSSLHGVWIVTIVVTVLSFAVPSLQFAAFRRAQSIYDRWPLWCTAISLISVITSALLWNFTAT